MKASELMIGDILRYKQDFPFASLQGKIAKVCGVDGRVDVKTIDDDKFHESEHPNWLEPIPLTYEILEKNGFRKLVTYGTEKWLCNNIRLNVYSSDGTWRFCADTNRNENSVIYIHFVHQLQHALKLCGIDKEIVL